MENINNVGKFDNVEEDEGNINDHKTHKMPHATSSIKATCFKKCYLFTHKRILT
jgi:hypothetical protein